MQDAPPPEGLAPTLRYLKTLVTALAVTMIAGVIILVAVVVIRLPAAPAPLTLPEGLKLPAGETVNAITQGQGWIAIVTGSGKILVFDGKTGALRHSYALGD